MTEIITQILAEVLKIFGFATKELRRRWIIKFLRNLFGKNDLEDALKRLDRLTQEENWMVNAEVLSNTHSLLDSTNALNSGVEEVGVRVEEVGDKVQCVDGKLRVVIEDGNQTRADIQQVTNKIDDSNRKQLIQLLQSWLSPADPSTNHDIAQNAQCNETTVWLFQGRIITQWKSSGSLLWIHGKPGSGKSVICSSIIEDITDVGETVSPIVTYFYFDFNDSKKQTHRDLLLSLVLQLSIHSSPCCDILHQYYELYSNGTRQLRNDTLKKCLKQMLELPEERPIFIVLDALDECPDSSGLPPPRTTVLQLLKELVEFPLRRLHICATSRPEADIREVLEPLASRSVSLHDESGQTADIAHYIRTVVNSSSSPAMKTRSTDDKNLVIKTLTERADGMFRWVFCQLDALQHCSRTNLPQYLNELPESLDETYERILKGINKAQKDNARRLLQCLTVAARPLRVEELAELLAFDFQASTEGGIPTSKEDRWRDDEVKAVLSTCSSLITIIYRGNSRVVQFSHSSVMEFLTSPRLAQSPHKDISQFHIDLAPAHTIVAQACLAKLLSLDEHASNDSSAEKFPLLNYAAEYWVVHAQSEGVSSWVCDAMDDLFDSSKPHFAAWLKLHDVDERWLNFAPHSRSGVGSPLYYVAFCGFYDLAERLITEHPEQVNARGGHNLFPLPAALFNRHFRIADLLCRHDRTAVDVRGDADNTPMLTALINGRIDVVKWLLEHGADTTARTSYQATPLHRAAYYTRLDALQLLLKYEPDVNLRDLFGQTPLHEALTATKDDSEQRVNIVRQLLEHGADPNIRNMDGNTPLHVASSSGYAEAARLLLKSKAKVDEKGDMGRTPLQIAASKGHDEMVKLLEEYGVGPQS